MKINASVTGRHLFFKLRVPVDTLAIACTLWFSAMLDWGGWLMFQSDLYSGLWSQPPRKHVPAKPLGGSQRMRLPPYTGRPVNVLPKGTGKEATVQATKPFNVPREGSSTTAVACTASKSQWDRDPINLDFIITETCTLLSILHKVMPNSMGKMKYKIRLFEGHQVPQSFTPNMQHKMKTPLLSRMKNSLNLHTCQV